MSKIAIPLEKRRRVEPEEERDCIGGAVYCEGTFCQGILRIQNPLGRNKSAQAVAPMKRRSNYDRPTSVFARFAMGLFLICTLRLSDSRLPSKPGSFRQQFFTLCSPVGSFSASKRRSMSAMCSLWLLLTLLGLVPSTGLLVAFLQHLLSLHIPRLTIAVLQILVQSAL